MAILFGWSLEDENAVLAISSAKNKILVVLFVMHIHYVSENKTGNTFISFITLADVGQY